MKPTETTTSNQFPLIELPNGSWVDPSSVRAVTVLAPSPQAPTHRVAVFHKDGCEIITPDGDPVKLAAQLADKINQFQQTLKLQMLTPKL